jgi:hypothetical protein
MSDTSDSYDSTYDSSYDTSLDITTSYDTAAGAPVVDPAAYLPADATIEQTGSYSYDSTDWSAVAEVSAAYTDVYQADSAVGNDLYQASVDAYLQGDSMGAYELNQASLEAYASSDVAWDASNSSWTDLEQTTVVDSYVATGYEATGYETTGYEAAPVDTSWSAAPVDTSGSAPTSDSFINDVIYEGNDAGSDY